MISFSAELPDEPDEYSWFEPGRLPAVPSAFRAFRDTAANG